MPKKQFKIWDFVKQWHKMMPPAKPSKAELRIFQLFLKNIFRGNKRARVLIFGSTPEFRDLVWQLGGSPVCADINPESFKLFRELTKFKGQENFIYSDWLKIKNKQSFDAIIGHQSFNMLPWQRWVALTKHLKELLKPNGLVIQVITVRWPRDKKITVLDGFKYYRRLSKFCRRPLFSEVQRYVLLDTYNRLRRKITAADMYNSVNNLFKKGLITQKERNQYCFFSPSKITGMYVPLKFEVDKIFKRYFSEITIKYHPQDSWSKNWPIYILKNN